MALSVMQTRDEHAAPAAAPVEVRPFAPADERDWEEFVALCPSTTFFHRAGWQRVIARSLGHAAYYRCAWRGDRLVGILPLIHVRSPLFGNALTSLGFAVYGGIAALDDAASHALAADAAALGQSLRVDYVELRHQAAAEIGWVAKSDLYVTFRREMSSSHDANLKAIPRKKRADLRKAIDNPGLRVDTAADIRTFFAIYSESVRNLGTPILPRRFYAAIAEEFGPDVEVSTVAGPQGPVSALMTFFFKDQVMPYYGGATRAARPLHAYDLMYWSLMRRAVERGLRVFDFGRSKRGTGSFDYKTYWGFAPEPLHYQYHPVRQQALPDINPLNPKYRMMVDGWKRLPLPLANLLGPLIARQIA